MDQKSQKYDRQLRLWGEHGQACLESSHVCLINATAVGTEILKNLVLPGFGSFTIIDGKKADGADVGNNFFLEKSSIGQPRGKVCAELLKEMNDDVSGNFVDQDPKELIENNSEIFSQFSFVIATELPEKSILKLGQICWDLNIPLLIARCYGLFGYLRIVVPEHTVVETHPENPIDDLRLEQPLPDLQAFADEIDMSQMDSAQRSHVPYVLVLLKAAKKWKESHDGQSPKNSAEKDEFKSLIRSFGELVDQNIDEAVANAVKIWTKAAIPSGVLDVISDPACKQIDSKTSDFWILAKALGEFVNSKDEGNGMLPLQGSIPDMHSDTKSFTRVQEIYQAKAKQDIALISDRVRNICLEINRAPDSISQETIKRFCKNASKLTVIRYRSLKEEYESPKGSYIGSCLEDQENDLKIYVLLRAVSHFEEQFKRLPGIHDEEVETDIPMLKKSVLSVLGSMGISNSPIKDEFIHEICRFGASELHNIAAFLGGVGSQEVIKLITHQFVPANNTFFFNGIRGSCTTECL